LEILFVAEEVDCNHHHHRKQKKEGERERERKKERKKEREIGEKGLAGEAVSRMFNENVKA
jgi:hypothetical protein